MFGSCTVLSSSSLMIEIDKSRSHADSISAIEVLASMWLGLSMHYIDDLLSLDLIIICTSITMGGAAGRERRGRGGRA